MEYDTYGLSSGPTEGLSSLWADQSSVFSYEGNSQGWDRCGP